MDYTISTVIVLAEDQVAAQELTTDQYFIQGASETGDEPATHNFISGPLSNIELDALTNAPFQKWIRGPEWQTALAGMNLKQIIPPMPIIEEPVVDTPVTDPVVDPNA